MLCGSLAIPANAAAVASGYTRVEAEKGMVSFGNISDDANASGGRKLTDMAQQSGGALPIVKFIVKAPLAGAYKVKVGYSTTTNNFNLISVTNTNVAMTSLSATADMTTYAEKEISMNLVAGENTITLRGSSAASQYIDFDYLDIPNTLTYVNKDANTARGYYEAECAEARFCNVNLGTDGGYVNDIWDHDDPNYASRLTFNVTAPKDGTFTMTVKFQVTKVYATNSNVAEHNLKVNDVVAQSNLQYGTAVTNGWATKAFQVTLKKGANTVQFSKAVAKQGDVDLDVIHFNFTESYHDDYLTSAPTGGSNPANNTGTNSQTTTDNSGKTQNSTGTNSGKGNTTSGVVTSSASSGAEISSDIPGSSSALTGDDTQLQSGDASSAAQTSDQTSARHGFPIWAIVLIVVVVLGGGAAATFIVIRKKRSAN